ncbi:MAG: GMC family oxidoreductase N-terminal domain-containing protein [Synechococcaceae cyanobacterium]
MLVLEEGENFFETSDITHQRNWSRSYAEGDIFRLHQALTSDGLPILCGRACTMGGGGSINYTMIFESPEWLHENIGRDPAYWRRCMQELVEALQPREPVLTDLAHYVCGKLQKAGYSLNRDRVGAVPVLPEDHQSLIHPFPTQFDPFGQRVHSGVSMLEWEGNSQLDFCTGQRVSKLLLEPGPDGHRCVGLELWDHGSDEPRHLYLAADARLILCAGAASPSLLLEHRELLGNPAIGQEVNDHILLPFGIYLLPPELEVSLKDQYVGLMATSWPLDHTARSENTPSNQPVVANLDFFAGKVGTLLYLLAHLLIAFWLPNPWKRRMMRWPALFTLLKRLSLALVALFNGLDQLLSQLRHPFASQRPPHNLIAAILKFNIARSGHYTNPKPGDSKRLGALPLPITLECFAAGSADAKVAQAVICQHLPLMDDLGLRPHPLMQWLIRLLARLPYKDDQVESYVRHYRLYDLLTEQHLAGGCLFGSALDRGLEDPSRTGLVQGSSNIHVADLSAAPLPRVSPQMTAYLIGHHVGRQLRLAKYDKNPSSSFAQV